MISLLEYAYTFAFPRDNCLKYFVLFYNDFVVSVLDSVV